MSTIGSLLALMDPGIKPWSEGMQSVNQAQGSQLQNQTRLLELADLKRTQAAEQEYLSAIQHSPELQQRLFGGSVLGSLGPAGGPGGTLMPQPGVPGQDPTRYAGVSPQSGGPMPPALARQLMPQVTPPQSTLASLGPQPQGQMQAPPRNPLIEMAQRDPRAAMMLQQKMQKQQLDQLTIHEKHLDMGVKVSEAIARQLQGVTDQASMDEARERVRLIHPQAAAQIPQFYSKEAVAALQQRGVSLVDQATMRLNNAKSRKLDMEVSLLPEMYKKMLDEEEAVPAGQPGGGETAPTPAGAPAGTQVRSAGQPPPASDTTRAIRAEVARQGGDQALADLAVAVATQESYLNPNAVGDGGKSLGLFQLQRGAAIDAKIDPDRRADPALNIPGGVTYLKQKLAQAGGDVDKALRLYNGGGDPNYVSNVRRFLPGAQGTTGGTGTAQEPPPDPHIAQLDAKIKQRTRAAKIASLAENESLSTRLNDEANRLTEERKRLIEESRHQQERREEIPRAADKVRAEEQARYGEKQRQQAGPLLPKERREAFTGLRTDIRNEPTFKVYQDVRNGYQNVRIGAEMDSAQGDLAIINGMAKILDPSSAVMTGEARNVEEAQGQLQRWFNSPQRFFEGDRISADNRPRFLKMAHALAKEKLTTAQTELKSVYGKLAKESQIDFEELVPLPDLKGLEPGPNAKKFDRLFEQ